MALWYAINVQIGAPLWVDGLKHVKMGSKGAQFTRSGNQNGLGLGRGGGCGRRDWQKMPKMRQKCETKVRSR